MSCASRLNSSDDDGEPLYIQMVTALVLQLIQCVVHLPNDKDAFEECEKVTAKKIASGQKLTWQNNNVSVAHRSRPFLFSGGPRCVDHQLV